MPRSRPGTWWTDETLKAPNWLLVATGAVVVGSLIALPVTAHPSAGDAGLRMERRAGAMAPGTATSTAAPSVVVVGDSNTEMDSGNFAAGDIAPNSWVYQLIDGGLSFAGGWAVGGSTSADQLAGLEPAGADTFLIMTGTNDLRWRVPFGTTAEHVAGMVAKVRATRVVLLAIPPRERETTPTSAEFNARLRQLAARHGWTFYDGLAFVRAPGGGFVDAFTSDGVHLTAEAQRRFGSNVLGLLRGQGVSPESRTG